MKNIKHITQSIVNAIDEKSKLDDSVFSVQGMSSIKNKHLLNNLLNKEGVNYLEIGVHQGSTFISALYGNEVNSAYAIDDWTQFTEYNPRVRFMENCLSKGITNFKLLEGDCFGIDKSLIKDKINVYFYDGHHSDVNTAKSLTYFYDILCDEFIFIVDDINWGCVLEGIEKGIRDCGLWVVFSCKMFAEFTNDNDGWWNGFYVAILRKTKDK